MTVTEILANMICAFSGTVAYAIIFNVPKRYYLAGGMTGMTGLCTKGGMGSWS